MGSGHVTLHNPTELVMTNDGAHFKPFAAVRASVSAPGRNPHTYLKGWWLHGCKHCMPHFECCRHIGEAVCGVGVRIGKHMPQFISTSALLASAPCLRISGPQHYKRLSQMPVVTIASRRKYLVRIWGQRIGCAGFTHLAELSMIETSYCPHVT